LYLKSILTDFNRFLLDFLILKYYSSKNKKLWENISKNFYERIYVLKKFVIGKKILYIEYYTYYKKMTQNKITIKLYLKNRLFKQILKKFT